MRQIHTYVVEEAKFCRMDQRRPIADPDFILELYEAVRKDGNEKFFCFLSSHEKVFSLGGDLKFFSKCFKREDTYSLEQYGGNCIAIMNRIFRKKALTIAYVTGQAFGGGFEVLTAFDYIVANRNATFSLPEIKYNMFPGMGVYTFLSRKIGMNVAHKIITSGEVYTAQEMYDLGVVDKILNDLDDNLFPDLKKDRGLYYSMLTKKNIRKEEEVWDELLEGIHLWVECVMGMSPKDIEKIDRVVALQDRLFTGVTA